MDTSSNILARSGISPYQAITTGVPSIIPSPSQESRRSLITPQNCWSNYTQDTSAVVSHGTCNFTPYSGLGAAGAGAAAGHKPSYSSFSSGTDFLPTNCQLNQLNHLNSLPPPRNFPLYSDVYQSNHPGLPGGGIFSDLASIPTIPRYETESGASYINSDSSSANPGLYLPLFYHRVNA